jgi:P4 family phage/plasmid primase-like protien
MNNEIQKIKDNLDCFTVLIHKNIYHQGHGNISCPLGTHEDKNPSFSIYDNGKRFKCFSCGKQGDAIDLYHFLSGKDGQPDKETIEACKKLAGVTDLSKNSSGKPKIEEHIADYDYYTTQGVFVYQKRYFRMTDGSKITPYRSKDDTGNWINGLNGKAQTLFRQEVWYKQLDKNLLHAEGEGDILYAESLGFLATTSGGAESWKDSFKTKYTDRDVIILQDNDEPGKKYAEQVAVSIFKKANSVKLIPPFEGDKKGFDLKDWGLQLEAEGMTKEQIAEKLKQIIDSTEPLTLSGIEKIKGSESYKEPKDHRQDTSPVNGQKGGKPPITKDISDAFVEMYQDENSRFLFARHRGQWYKYQDNHYQSLSDEDLNSVVMEFLRNNYPKNAAKNMLINVNVNLGASDLGGIPSGWNMPCWRNGEEATGLLIMENGIIDVEKASRLERDAFQGHTVELFSTFAVPYKFDAKATCPMFQNYLEGVQPDPEAREVLQMMAGLSLVPDTSYEVIFILYGEGGTGKTVFLHILEHLVGKDNFCCLPLNKFIEKHSTHLLTEKLLNIVGDLPTAGNGVNLNQIEGILKDIASGGNIPVERKNKDPLTAPAIARCVFASNSLPSFADRSDGIWDRLRIIPFNQKFRGSDKQNPNLKYDIVKNELPGVFNWALEGLNKLRKLRRFPDAPDGIKLVQEHRLNCDHEKQFLSEYYETSNGSYVVKSHLYTHYREFCCNNGYHSKNSANFNCEVKRVFPEAFENRKRIHLGNVRLWQNIKKAS